jgi:hypothetical protein
VLVIGIIGFYAYMINMSNTTPHISLSQMVMSLMPSSLAWVDKGCLSDYNGYNYNVFGAGATPPKFTNTVSECQQYALSTKNNVVGLSSENMCYASNSNTVIPDTNNIQCNSENLHIYAYRG